MFSDCISGIHVDFMSSVCMWFKQGFFCHRLFGNMSDSFELVEGMEELYFGADQVSIPESDDSAGRAQYYVESYVYEPEEPLNAPGLGENSEATSAEDSTAQMPILPGCFITASGTCVHSSGCHHGKRAEVQKIPVSFVSVSQKVVSDICHTLLKYSWIFVISYTSHDFVRHLVVGITLCHRWQSRGL